MSQRGGETQGLLQGTATKHGDVSAEPRLEPVVDVLGKGKHIGTLGSVAFIANQVYGPGVLVLPVALLNAGWFWVFTLNVVVWLISALGSLMLVEAISKISGNKNFTQRVEFSTLVLTYLSRPWANVARTFYHGTMILFNVCSIVICSQGMDNTLLWMFGHTYALQFQPHFKFKQFDESGRNAINGLYSGELYRTGITLGYFLISLFTIPLGAMSISGSMYIQIVSFFFTTGYILIFFIQFCTVWESDKKEVRSHHLEAFEDGDYSLCVTATVVSYMYSMYMPTWLAEKTDDVPIKRTIWTITTAAMGLYIVVGISCAVAYPYLKARNVMQYLYENDQTTPFLKIVILVFIFTAVLPGIPINAISIRYNLYVSRLCNRRWSFFWGSCAPFLFAWFFSNREMAVGVCMWSLVLMGGYVNFLLPPYLFYKAHVAASEGRSIPLIQDEELLEGGGLVEQYWKCGTSPRLQGLGGLDAIMVPDLTDEDMPAAAVKKLQDTTPNEKAYVFEGAPFKWLRVYYGRIPLLMNAVFVFMVSFAVYWRVAFTAVI